MTDAEKKRDRELKSEVVSWLRDGRESFPSRYSHVLDTDPRLWQYISANIDHPDGHNLYELLAIRRFFEMADRYGWNPKRVRKFIKFYELVPLSGTTGRRTYRLTPVQTFQFANIFGFTDEKGRRLIRNAYLFVPRKFSKTPSVAVLAVHDLLFGDNNAQAYIGANSYNQAKICFDEIRAIMRTLDPTGRHFRINREKITVKSGKRDSLVQCLTANARTLDGLNASLVVMDEYAQARNTAGKSGDSLKNVLTSSMGIRNEPLTVVITTASDVVDGPFHDELEGVKRVLRGEAEPNDMMFASLFMPDVDDREDDPETWAKVQPHLGITVQPDFYEKEWKNAQLSAGNMLAFRTKLLNIFTLNEDKVWFTHEQAQSLVSGFDIDRISGHPECAVSFDLSVKDDFSAVSYTMYDSSSKMFYSHTDYYFPEGQLEEHPNREQYLLWVRQGYLKLCKGKVIDVRMIADDIYRRTKKIVIIRIAYDNWKSQELTNALYSLGAKSVLVPFSQTYGNFNLPVESFEMMAFTDPPKIRINNNPINIFCLTNCVIDEDILENKKPVKASQYRKIDGAITMLMGLGSLLTYER